MIEFDIKEKRENIRLRKHYKKFDYLEDCFTGQEGFALGDLQGIKSFTWLKVEIKKDDEIFDVYNKNLRHYQIIFWTEGITSLKDLPYKDFTFDYTKKSQEFIKLLSEKYKIPLKEIRAYQKKKDLVNNITYGVLLGSEVNYSKSLKSLGLMSNSKIFVERVQEGEKSR